MKHVEYGTLGGVWATNARLAQRSAIHPSPASLVLPPPHQMCDDEGMRRADRTLKCDACWSATSGQLTELTLAQLAVCYEVSYT